MAFPTTAVLDNFNRTAFDSIEVGDSNWTQIGTGAQLIINNDGASCRPNGTGDAAALRNNLSATDVELFFTLAASGTGYYCQWRMKNVTRTGDPTSSGSWSGYYMQADATSGQVKVFKYSAGSFNTQLGSTISQALAAGDAIGVEMIGSQIKVYYKAAAGSWTQIGSTITDSTFTDAGRICLELVGSTGYIVDDFGGGGISVAQNLTPSADSVDGTWTDQAAGTSLAAAIDETSASDTDYIQSVDSPSAAGCRVKLATGQDPFLSTGHVIHWRIRKSSSDQTMSMTVKLYQGGGNSLGAGTLIATRDRNGISTSFTTFDEALTGTEADAITDYGDLYLEFYATAS